MTTTRTRLLAAAGGAAIAALLARIAYIIATELEDAQTRLDNLGRDVTAIADLQDRNELGNEVEEMATRSRLADLEIVTAATYGNNAVLQQPPRDTAAGKALGRIWAKVGSASDRVDAEDEGAGGAGPADPPKAESPATPAPPSSPPADPAPPHQPLAPPAPPPPGPPDPPRPPEHRPVADGDGRMPLEEALATAPALRGKAAVAMTIDNLEDAICSVLLVREEATPSRIREDLDLQTNRQELVAGVVTKLAGEETLEPGGQNRGRRCYRLALADPSEELAPAQLPSLPEEEAAEDTPAAAAGALSGLSSRTRRSLERAAENAPKPEEGGLDLEPKDRVLKALRDGQADVSELHDRTGIAHAVIAQCLQRLVKDGHAVKNFNRWGMTAPGLEALDRIEHPLGQGLDACAETG